MARKKNIPKTNNLPITENTVPENSVPEIQIPYIREDSISEIPPYIMEDSVSEIPSPCVMEDSVSEIPPCVMEDTVSEILNELIINTDYYIGNIEALKNEKEYSLDNNALDNLLNNNFTINIDKKYNLNDLKKIYSQFNSSIMIVEIFNEEIKFMEKKGYESRNQSVIDLLMKTNSYKKLPNCQFIIFTDDFIKNISLAKNSFLLTFCKKYSYNTNLFPNFNFNHWLEAKIDKYEEIYNKFINNNISWNDKKDIIFWSGANTNIIREKMNNEAKNHPNYYINLIDKNNTNYISIDETMQYKYLLNMNGYSYSGRLNYLFLTGSCVIILKDENQENTYEEFYYKYFVPNEDFIEILYNDKDTGIIIINKINQAILNNDCEKMALRSLEKAKNIFEINNIYEYTHNLIMELSKMNDHSMRLNNTICYTPKLDYFFKNRIKVINNEFSFYFIGKDFEINIITGYNIINLKITDINSKIYYKNDLLLDKYTPYLLNEKKNQHYKISINDNILLMTIEKKFVLIKCEIPDILENINDVEIKSSSGGWWLI